MDEDKKRMLTFQATETQAVALEALASQRNQSVSQLIRDILGLVIPAFAPVPPPELIPPTK